MAKRKTPAEWQPYSEHKWEFDLIWRVYSNFLTMVIAGLLFGALGLFMMTGGLANPDQESGVILTGVAIFVTSLCVIGYACYTCPWRPVKRMAVCPAGVKFTKAGQQHQYTWKEIATIRRTARETFVNGQRDHFRSVAFVDLTFTDKFQVRLLPGLRGYDKLAQSVQDGAAQAQLPEAFADLDEGMCEFGPIDLTRKGIQRGSQFFTWKKLGGMRIVNGTLRPFRDVDGFAPIVLASIPDYMLLLLMLEDLGYYKGSQQYEDGEGPI